jgi:hypothetical protein
VSCPIIAKPTSTARPAPAFAAKIRRGVSGSDERYVIVPSSCSRGNAEYATKNASSAQREHERHRSARAGLDRRDALPARLVEALGERAEQEVAADHQEAEDHHRDERAQLLPHERAHQGTSRRVYATRSGAPTPTAGGSVTSIAAHARPPRP